MREFIAASAAWLTMFQLPTYAPDLNPREGIWSLINGDAMTEGLPDEVAEVLGLVLSTDEPVHVALRGQVPHLSVRSCCTCGCGTVCFELDTSEVEPAPTGPDTVVAADVQLYTETGECPGEVLVFAQGGYLSRLEVCSWSDEIEVNPAAARRWLQPRP